MARIVVVGSARQTIYLVDHDDLVPTEIGDTAIFGKVTVGRNVEIDKMLYTVGGSGLNVATACARHQHEVILMSNISRDAAGDAIMRTLDREEIDSSYINYVPGKDSGSAVILLDSKTGAETILSHTGVSGRFMNLDAKDLELTQPDWLYLSSLEGDFDKLSEFLTKAHSMKIKVILTPGEKETSEPQKLLQLLKYVNVLILNKERASALVPGSLLKELAYRMNNYVETIVITDGAMGGIAGNRTSGETYRFGIYEDVKVRDHVGVRDGFAGGFLAHYAAGKSLRASLIFASACATNVATKIGETTGLLTGGETLHPMPIQKI